MEWSKRLESFVKLMSKNSISGVRGRARAAAPLPPGEPRGQIHRLAQQLRGARPPSCQV